MFVLKLAPVLLCKMIIWSQNCPFVLFLWWNKNGDSSFFNLCFFLIIATQKIYPFKELWCFFVTCKIVVHPAKLIKLSKTNQFNITVPLLVKNLGKLLNFPSGRPCHKLCLIVGVVMHACGGLEKNALKIHDRTSKWNYKLLFGKLQFCLFRVSGACLCVRHDVLINYLASRFSGIFVLMLKLVLNGPMAKNESTITCLIVNEVHSMHPGLNGAASFPSLP